MIASDSFVRRGGGNHEFLSLLMQEGNFPFVYKISPGNLEQDKGLLCKFLNFPHVIHHLHTMSRGLQCHSEFKVAKRALDRNKSSSSISLQFWVLNIFLGDDNITN